MLNLLGKRFGRLVVVEQVGRDKRGNYLWLCKCDCKNEIVTRGYDLQGGKTKSCGCLRKETTRERSIKHDHLKNRKITGFYRSWQDMVQRCTNPNNKQWKNYGGRGIKVCKRWRSFSNFLKDMGKKPERHQIDRIDNNKGYFKDNCRWVTSKINNRNRRNNHLEIFNGETQCLIEWAEKFNINYITLWNRIHKLGWSIEKALTTPVRVKRHVNNSKSLKGENNGKET